MACELWDVRKSKESLGSAEKSILQWSGKKLAIFFYSLNKHLFVDLPNRFMTTFAFRHHHQDQILIRYHLIGNEKLSLSNLKRILNWMNFSSRFGHRTKFFSFSLRSSRRGLEEFCAQFISIFPSPTPSSEWENEDFSLHTFFFFYVASRQHRERLSGIIICVSWSITLWGWNTVVVVIL